MAERFAQVLLFQIKMLESFTQPTETGEKQNFMFDISPPSCYFNEFY